LIPANHFIGEKSVGSMSLLTILQLAAATPLNETGAKTIFDEENDDDRR
jgi:hypothetical protein